MSAFADLFALRQDQIDHQEGLILGALSKTERARRRANENIRAGLTALLGHPDAWRRMGPHQVPDTRRRKLWAEIRRRGELLVDIETERYRRALLPKGSR